ncbi:MAG: hypothetical protein QM820_08035 [Minicystis sp.]
MANRKRSIEPLAMSMTPRVVVPVRRVRVDVAIDLFANAALRWLCRGHATSSVRILAVSR